MNNLVKTKAPKALLPLLSRTVPFIAVGAAGTLNVYLMRRKELIDGIQVFDDNGKVLGKSQIAGSTAIQQVALSRIVTAAPALFIPGLIMSQLEKTSFLKRNPRAALPLNLLTVTASLMVALPCATAIAPQTASLDVKDAEKEFQNKGISRIYFNRGL
jgi:hypothetical protein